MPIYLTAASTAAAAAASAIATFHTGANRRAFIREINISLQSATYTPFGLVFAANVPVATTSTTPVALDANDAVPTCGLDTTWSTAPTIGGSPLYLRQFDLGPAIGAGVIYKVALDERLVVPKSSWLVFWNLSAALAGACHISIEYDE